MENKDEQIRKELIYFIRKEKEYIESKVKPENSPKLMFLIDALAYLEKQKEQKPLMYDGEIEDTKRDIVAAIRKYYPADYAEYLTSFLKGLSPEDNSEDEYGQEMLGIAYKLMYEHIPENLRTQEFWNSLKFMREYTGRVAIIHFYEKPAEQLSGIFTSYDMAKTFTEGQNYVIAHPEKFGLCKPAEWSEEDERMLEPIISDLRELCNCETDEELISDYEDRIAWLKSLRPQPHWKSSEEQMRALERAIVKMHTPNDISILAELRDNLKKL